jgi:hypothetical protein
MKAKPAKVLEHGGNEFRFGTVAVEIFVTEDESSVVGLCALLRNPERAGVSDVQKTSGRRGEPTAV